MRKILLIIPAVLILILAVRGFWIYKNKYQPTIKTKEIVVSPAELAEAEKIERFLLPPETASVSAKIDPIIVQKARERVTRRKILEREMSNFKIDSNAPAFAPDGRIFPPDLARIYNYDNLLTEAAKEKIEGAITLKTTVINFLPKLQSQAEKTASELFNGQSATASAGITINNFSSVLVGDAAKNFRPDEKPVLASSPMGQSYIFRKIVSQEKGLGTTFEQWLKKFL